jgi:hypothetical protein
MIVLPIGFVADFIGETNFLELLTQGKGKAKVQLDAGATIEAGLADGITAKEG